MAVVVLPTPPFWLTMAMVLWRAVGVVSGMAGEIEGSRFGGRDVPRGTWWSVEGVWIGGGKGVGGRWECSTWNVFEGGYPYPYPAAKVLKGLGSVAKVFETGGLRVKYCIEMS
jgi:hypothetical protein